MKMKMRHIPCFFAAVLLLASLPDAGAQETTLSPQRLLFRADSLRKAYDFKGAVTCCEQAIERLDSTRRGKAEEQLTFAQNGLNMTGFCSQPTVVARRTFPLKDFFLYYPLEDRSWHSAPNALIAEEDETGNAAVYFPEGAQDIYYSAKGDKGVRTLLHTHRQDSVWTAPDQPLDNLDEEAETLFPMVSPDGKRLYFAAKGLYGMGGYDLYVSTREGQDDAWGVPVNMGFPYSSPYDDFLFINTQDGRYSIFASNRSCRRDSVSIYVLEYDEMPVRMAVDDIATLRNLADLTPQRDPARIEGTGAPANPLEAEATRQYMEQMKVVRSLRDSVSQFGATLDRMRSAYSEAPDSDKPALAKAISEKELSLPELNSALSAAVTDLQQIEMDFLLKGVVLDADALMNEADKEVVGAADGFAFTRNRPGEGFTINILQPEPSFDFTFQILPEGRFAEPNTLPGGIVYQIQLFTQSRKAEVSDLRGITPVFEKINPSLSYTYSAGVFRTFREAQDNLQAVRSRGFRDAIITAYEDGTQIGVTAARKKESLVQHSYTVKIFPADGNSLGDQAIDLIHDHTDQDLIKTTEGGSVVYMAGPFNEKAAADALAAALKAAGAGTVSVEEEDS